MAAKTLYLSTALLNHVARGIPFAMPAAMYVALYTVAPTSAGGGTEVVGGSYARQLVAFGAPNGSGVSANTGTITFPVAGASWGTIVAVAFLDAVTTGNMLYQGAVVTPKTVGVGDDIGFGAGILTIGES